MPALGTAVNVRFDEETERRLDHVAQRFGVKSSMLIRNAVRAYLDSIEGSDTIVIHAQEQGLPSKSDSQQVETAQSPGNMPPPREKPASKKRPKA